MHYHYKLSLVLILSFVSSFSVIGVPAMAAHLSATKITAPSLVLTSEKGFIVAPHEGDIRHRKRIRSSKVTITAVQGQLSLNGTKTRKSSLYIEPLNGSVQAHDRLHDGAIEVQCVGNNVELALQPVVVNELQTSVVSVTKQVETSSITTERYTVSVQDKTAQKANYQVRVLLDDQGHGEEGWNLYSAGGFIVYDRDDTTQTTVYHDDTLYVQVTHRGITCNKKSYQSECLVIVPVLSAEPIGYGDNCYQGVFLVMKHKDRGLLINRVELEDYVFSVLRTESWPGWPLEVNKAFAIASRSYAIAMIMRARETSLPYHIRNTNHHQTYSGLHTFKQLRAAVDETRGVFLSYANEPIIAMFDACCGGIIPAHISEFNFEKAPYLARDYPCAFCKRYKIYSWQAVCLTTDFAALLKKEAKKIDKIHDIKVTKRDKAGLVKKVTVYGNKTSVTVSGKRIYTLLKGVVSYAFSVDKEGSAIIFKGAGYGHHLGICQWGARGMIADGHDYRSVLSFYYPKTTFVRLDYTCS